MAISVLNSCDFLVEYQLEVSTQIDKVIDLITIIDFYCSGTIKFLVPQPGLS